MDKQAEPDRYVGIDVGKDRIEVHIRPDGISFGCATDAEGLSNALLEAMASGLPCVATDLAANREALGDAGLLVARDAKAIAQGLLELLHDPERARTLGRAARERVEDELELEAMVGRYAKLYLES